MSLDRGTDLPPEKLRADYDWNRCPRCGGSAYTPASRHWTQFSDECIWRYEDPTAGFMCRKELRDGRRAAKS